MTNIFRYIAIWVEENCVGEFVVASMSLITRENPKPLYLRVFERFFFQKKILH